MDASLFGPRAGWSVAQVGDPFHAREATLAALFVGERQIEVDVGVRRHGSRGATQVTDRFVDLALLFENAAEVVARDSAQWIELDGGGKFGARLIDPTHLIEGNAQINVRVDPLGCEFQSLAVAFDGLRQQIRFHFAIERFAEEFLGAWAGERMNLRGRPGEFERKRPLLFQRIERAIGAGRDHENVAPLLDKSQFLQRDARARELLFDQADCPPDAPRGHPIFGQALKRAQRNEVAEAVESLAPPSPGTDQPEPFPVAKTVRLNPQNAAYFLPRISFRQAPVLPCACSWKRLCTRCQPHVGSAFCKLRLAARADYQKTTAKAA